MSRRASPRTFHASISGSQIGWRRRRFLLLRQAWDHRHPGSNTPVVLGSAPKHSSPAMRHDGSLTHMARSHIWLAHTYGWLAHTYGSLTHMARSHIMVPSSSRATARGFAIALAVMAPSQDLARSSYSAVFPMLNLTNLSAAWSANSCRRLLARLAANQGRRLSGR